MFFRSRNLFLRPLWPEDTDGLKAAMGAENFERACSWMNASDAQVAAAQIQHPRLPRCLVTRPDRKGEHIVGVCALLARPDGVYLEIWISPRFRQKGFGREVTRAMVEIARAVGHRDLRARVAADCIAATRALLASGFKAIPDRGPTRSARLRSAIAAEQKYAVALVCHGDGGDQPSFAA